MAAKDPLARARTLTRMLDSAARVPGTRIRFGLDPLLGLIPGLGDVAGAALSGYLVLLAQRLGAPPADPLLAVLDVACRRITLVHPGAGTRLTADVALAFRARHGRAGRLAAGAVILESKSVRGHALADGVLRDLGARPVAACSKYCLGLALTRDDVRGNPFRRLLARWFEVAPA